MTRPWRVSLIARELGVGSRDVLEYLHRLGCRDIKTPSSRIEEPIFVEAVIARFSG